MLGLVFSGVVDVGLLAPVKADGDGHVSLLSCRLTIVFLRNGSDGRKIQLWEAFAHGIREQDLDVWRKLLGKVKELG